MGKGGVPDRWLDYKPMGTVIPGTRFLACKVPLKEALLRNLDAKERFGPEDLMKAVPDLGLLVDLTFTTRYYLKEEFTMKKIQYEKILCPGHVVPPNSIVKKFFNVVDRYLDENKDSDSVIAVHCTHGVNRTGYFICRYMIEKLNMNPEEALKNFQAGRGHAIERQNYVDDLNGDCKGGSESVKKYIYYKKDKRKHMGEGMDDAQIFEPNQGSNRDQGQSRKRNKYNPSRGDVGYYRGSNRQFPASQKPMPYDRREDRFPPGQWRREQHVNRSMDTSDVPNERREDRFPPGQWRREQHVNRSMDSSDTVPTKASNARNFGPPNRRYQPRPPPPGSSLFTWTPNGQQPVSSWTPLPHFGHPAAPGVRSTAPITRRVYSPQVCGQQPATVSSGRPFQCGVRPSGPRGTLEYDRRRDPRIPNAHEGGRRRRF